MRHYERISEDYYGGWLAAISADLREAVAHLRRDATMRYTNTPLLAVDGWTVTFGTARRGLGGAAARPGPSSLYQT